MTINEKKKIHVENESLNSNLRQMDQKLMENRNAVNELNQYNRPSHMVELSGILFGNHQSGRKNG